MRGSQNAIEVLERHIEGLATAEEMQTAWVGTTGDSLDAANAIAHPGEVDLYAISYAAHAVDRVRQDLIANAAFSAAQSVAYHLLSQSGTPTLTRIVASWRQGERWRTGTMDEIGRYWREGENEVRNCVQYECGLRDEQSLQCLQVHDIFGNPFRTITIEPSWLTSDVIGLARQMYDSRDFSPMPILADALQDAGCDNEDIINHCRLPGEHVRGCWVIDRILGKE